MPALVGILLFLGIVSTPCFANPAAHQVLVLQSYHQGQRWTDQQLHGIRNALDSNHEPYALYVEHLDTKRWSDDAYLDSFRQLLLTKYASVLLDAIVATDNSAFEFIREHRDALFGQVPVVFSGVNFFRESMRDDLAQVTGVAETFDAGATIELMLKLHPETRRIVIVIDSTTTGSLLRRELEQVLEGFDTDVHFDIWHGRTLPNLQQDLATLRDGDLVLLMPFARDGAGRHLEFHDAATIVRGATDVPIYGTWDFFLGHGIVGGRLTTAVGQGESAGRLLLRVIAGEQASDIAVQHVAPTEFQFDARELDRHGISERRLPDGSRVFFRSWFAEHRIVIGLFMLLALLSLALLLAWQRKRAEKRKAEQRLEQNEQTFRELFELSPDPTWIIEDGNFIDCNRAAVRMLEYHDKQQLFAVGPAELSPPEQPDGQTSASKAAKMMALALDRGIHRFEWVHRRRGGDDFWAEVTLSRLDNDHHNRLYCVWRDISTRKQADDFIKQHAETLEQQVAERTAALQTALLEAEQANLAKSRFLANVSHELRTPMHAILGYAKLGTKQSESDRSTKYFDKILSSGERLTLLVNDLLDLSKLEANGLKTDIRTHDLHRLTLRAIDEMRILADPKNIRIELMDEGVQPLPFDTDLMLRVMINLLSNAIKFSSADTRITVALQSRRAENDRQKPETEIIVTDAGIGIPEGELETVFEKFEQSELTRGNGNGTGLGLAICKEIVHLHHGRIWAVSPPAGQARGTAIHILLPSLAQIDFSASLREAFQAHDRWMALIERRVRDSLSSAHISAAMVASPQLCHLGRWITEQKHLETNARVPLPLEALDAAHRRLHELGGRLVEVVDAGETPTDTDIAAFKSASQQVKQLLQPSLRPPTNPEHDPEQRPTQQATN
jgi:PAS domain S-box-containing protein